MTKRCGLPHRCIFPTSVITPFQLRYETDIRNDEEMRIASSLYFSDKRHHAFSVGTKRLFAMTKSREKI
jgi:hypothetical protein